MSSITITGGGLIGLFCADILSSNHDVTIIEINAEIGFPANFPGIINQSNNISKLLDSEQLLNLYIYENGNNINFWFLSKDSSYILRSGDMNHKGNVIFL